MLNLDRTKIDFNTLSEWVAPSMKSIWLFSKKVGQNSKAYLKWDFWGNRRKHVVFFSLQLKVKVDIFVVQTFSYKLFWQFIIQKIKFSTNTFFSKREQIRSFLQIWSDLLKKSLLENLILCAVVYSILQKLIPWKNVSSETLLQKLTRHYTFELNLQMFGKKIPFPTKFT